MNTVPRVPQFPDAHGVVPGQPPVIEPMYHDTIHDAGHGLFIALVVGLGCACLWAAYVIIKFGGLR